MTVHGYMVSFWGDEIDPGDSWATVYALKTIELYALCG